jgi:hypothetical protein
MSSTCSSSWCECLRGLRAAWPLDVALDVVTRSIATHECPAELDRGVVGGERDAFDEEGRRAAALAQQARLARAQEDRLQGLAGTDDGGPVARRHELVERGVLEVAGEQSREPLGRQVDLLEQVWLTAGEAEALEIQRGRAGLEAQGRRDTHRRRLGAGGDQARLRIEATLLHLVGEAGTARDVALQARSKDVRAASAGALDAALLGELAQGAADGDQADAVLPSQLALRGQAIARLPRAIVQRSAQVEVDLVVHGDRTERNAETGGHCGGRFLRRLGEDQGCADRDC